MLEMPTSSIQEQHPNSAGFGSGQVPGGGGQMPQPNEFSNFQPQPQPRTIQTAEMLNSLRQTHPHLAAAMIQGQTHPSHHHHGGFNWNSNHPFGLDPPNHFGSLKVFEVVYFFLPLRF